MRRRILKSKRKPQFNQKQPLVKKKLSDLLRVAIVNNFLGEEAKVVIDSLIGANNEKKVGFVRTTIRISVLLSRARHGMYLVGNAETYSNVPVWQKVIDIPKDSNAIGRMWSLCSPSIR